MNTIAVYNKNLYIYKTIGLLVSNYCFEKFQKHFQFNEKSGTYCFSIPKMIIISNRLDLKRFFKLFNLSLTKAF